MYLRNVKQKMVDFETKLEDYKSKLLMSDEASPVVVTRINEHVICPLVTKNKVFFFLFLPMSTSFIAVFGIVGSI